MLKERPSPRKLERLNRRQRKKLRVGEFQEMVFEVHIRFCLPLENVALNAFWDSFIALIESRRLIVGGFGGQLPLHETNGVVSAARRGSLTEEDRQAVLSWLQQQPDVATAEIGLFVDGWYGWENAQ